MIRETENTVNGLENKYKNHSDSLIYLDFKNILCLFQNVYYYYLGIILHLVLRRPFTKPFKNS